MLHSGEVGHFWEVGLYEPPPPRGGGPHYHPGISVGVTLSIVVVGIISILILVSQELAQQGLDVNQSLLLNLHSLFLGI